MVPNASHVLAQCLDSPHAKGQHVVSSPATVEFFLALKWVSTAHANVCSRDVSHQLMSHVGENRHGNLGTHSGDGDGDNPLLLLLRSIVVGLWVEERAGREVWNAVRGGLAEARGAGFGVGDRRDGSQGRVEGH